MAVLEQKVETRRTYIMTREGAQVVAEFTELNPNQLMEYAMEQIQLPPQIQAQIDARPYKNPNEMLEWAMQEIQLPPQLEDHLQCSGVVKLREMSVQERHYNSVIRNAV
ncbi:Protein of unknown function [Gryllus bimaculatus]|nr:Protein of unknown function [Gryllus bimaculatus]